jgi:competence protein ComEC
MVPSMAFSPLQTHVAVHRKLGAFGGFIRLENWLEDEREQLGLWLPVALGCGIAAWFALPYAGQWIGWISLWSFVALVALRLPDGGRVQRSVIVFSLTAAAGCALIWGKALMLGEKPIAKAAFVEVRGRVIALQSIPARSMTRLVVQPEPQRADLPAQLRVNVDDADRMPGMGVGALVQFRSRLMPPAPPSVPGAYDFAQKAYFSQVGATGRVLPPLRIITPAQEDAMPLRQRLAEHIRGRLSGGEGAIAAALATGDTGAIPQEDADAMRASGLAHLLSISGLHVSALIAGVIFLIMRTLALSRRLALGLPVLAIAAAGGALAGIGYTLLTGAEVPTVRSCVAALLVLAGLAMGREAITLRLIATGALVVLIFWPEALVGPSFQMSFMAVIVIVALGEARWFREWTHAREEGWPARLGRALLATFLIGLAVELALMPIALYHFHRSGLLGALANLVAIPLTTFVIMPCEALALALDIIGLGAPTWWIVGKALELLLVIAHGVAAQTSGLIALPSFGAWAFVVMTAGFLWLCLWHSKVRYCGLGLAGIGMIGVALTPQPDLLVTGDGRHMSVRLPDGRFAILRDRAGEYVRDSLGAAGGAAGTGESDASLAEEAMPAIADLPNARCSDDLCVINVIRGGRSVHILATRSRYRLAWADMVKACAEADIAVSERFLPRACHPRWLKLDRAALEERGGAAVYFTSGRIIRVREQGDQHPWVLHHLRAHSLASWYHRKSLSHKPVPKER